MFYATFNDLHLAVSTDGCLHTPQAAQHCSRLFETTVKDQNFQCFRDAVAVAHAGAAADDAAGLWAGGGADARRAPPLHLLPARHRCRRAGPLKMHMLSTSLHCINLSYEEAAGSCEGPAATTASCPLTGCTRFPASCVQATASARRSCCCSWATTRRAPTAMASPTTWSSSSAGGRHAIVKVVMHISSVRSMKLCKQDGLFC
jgi:hypothetical protein